jgi:DNA-binding transcriptional MerR regulator
MADLTVKQLAAISGVTVRALHHYDEIGLLKPATVGANGYRYYGRRELLRLQRILFHRELGVPLSEIAELLEMEGDDQIGALLRHRERLLAEQARFSQLIETIDRTVADLKGEDTMTNADLYKGFSAEKQAEYEAWLIDTYGGDMADRIAQSKKAMVDMTDAEREQFMRELQSVETALAEAKRRGLPPDAAAVDPVIARHRAWVAGAWGRVCTAEAYAGLADLYGSHADFRKRYETIEPGFTDWLTAAMKAHAAKG